MKGLRESRNLAQMQTKDIEDRVADRLDQATRRLEIIARAMVR